MSQENQQSFKRFHQLMLAAYRDFLHLESEQLGPDSPPAVSAARFNEFISMHYPLLRDAVTPDLCEAYMQRYHYLKPLDEGTDEPLSHKQRHAQACLAYGEFRSLTSFKGSKEAELLAFYDFVSKKYPLTLPDFTEDEASNAIAAWHSKRQGSWTKIVLGAVLSLATASMLIPALQREEETPKFRDSAPVKKRRLTDQDNMPQWNQPPAIRPWEPPMNPPFIIPDGGQPDPKVMEEWQKKWQEKFKPLDDTEERANKNANQRRR